VFVPTQRATVWAKRILGFGLAVTHTSVNNSALWFPFFVALLMSSWHAGESADLEPSSAIGVRNAHSMTYDSKRARVVLFGGADAEKVCGDTWEWNGSKWSQVSVIGPGPRTFPAMAYDSIRQKTVLFGGNRVLFGNNPDDNKFLDDTWEWDGRTWVQMNVSGPAPRAEAAIAFDYERGRMVLFGGYSLTRDGKHQFGDTWEWDGTNWRQLKVTGPSPRNGAAATYDSARRRVVLFGGSASGAVSGETWEWDGRQWTENRAALTQGRFNCVMAYDAAAKKVIRFGGRYNGKPFGDTWEYDGELWTQLTTSGPTARNHTAMVYDSRLKHLVLFGGHDFGLKVWTDVYGDTWEWNGSIWRKKDAGEIRKRNENGH
jgi:hypothetical protein